MSKGKKTYSYTIINKEGPADPQLDLLGIGLLIVECTEKFVMKKLIYIFKYQPIIPYNYNMIEK